MRKVSVLTLALAGSFLAATTAQAAPPNPFGHPCAPRDGVLFCPTASDADRVPSFDGVPLDVDVTLPATGDGPFPAIVMLHGYGGTKRSFQSATAEGNGTSTYHYNDLFYAQQGYAVITPSSRGFGRSCGVADSRTAPACDRGWVHLDDQRYEGRDVQYLVGLLVDQGVVSRRAIGVTGISYGGILTHSLARLRDRIRLASGAYRPWRSSRGTPLEVNAAWARWGATDLAYSLQPNGRFLDFGPFSPRQSRTVPGVLKQSYVSGLYLLGNLSGYYAPQGVDRSADLTGWKAITDRGEPYRADARAVARELTTYHSGVGVSGVPAPLLVQNGWTDDLFPATEALRAHVAYRGLRGARVALQLGDLGHARGSNKANADRAFNDQGARFFDALLRGRGKAPRHGSVTAFTQTCPQEAPAGGPFRARSWSRLHPGRLLFGARPVQRVTSDGGNADTGAVFDRVTAGDACATVPTERAPGTAIAQRRIRDSATMLGLPTVRASIRTRGRGGYLAARLWDVHEGNQTLISRGVYRLQDAQRGRIRFQLFGNGWRLEQGHVVKLELLGRDPNFLRPSNFDFSVRISRLRVSLPTREASRR
jgi:predicted acyl esterase